MKREYPISIYPLIDILGCKTVALEPSEPEYSELVGMFRKTMKELEETEPSALEHFNLYVNSLYEVLFDWWNSPIDVNSLETDRHFEIKHRYQRALFDGDMEKGWELWNSHFLNKIIETAQRNRDSRMLVLVGVEYAYWLRKKLRGYPELKLLDTAEVLSQIMGTVS